MTDPSPLKALLDDATQTQPHLHHELPYRTVDPETGLFQNAASHGLGWRLGVLGGANDELIHSLNQLISECPQGHQWDYQLALLGHHRVAHYLEANAREMGQRGGLCARLAKQELDYARFAASEGFFHHHRHHFDLRDYDAHLFISTTTQDDEALLDLRATIETALGQLGIPTERLTPAALLTWVGDILNFDPHQDRPAERPYHPHEPLHAQCLSPDTEMLIHRRHIQVRHTNEAGQDTHTLLVHLGLKRLPRDFRLYALPECFASLRNVARHLTCPHLLTVNFRQAVTGQVEHDNNRKIHDLTRTVRSPMALLLPTAADELAERKDVQKGLADKAFTLSSMVLTLTLFTDDAHQRRDTQAAKEAFSATGLDLVPQVMLQSQSLLGTLPFMMSEGLWHDAQVAGRVRTLKSSNLVNFFPLVLDYKRLTGGVLLPTMRGQISFFDPFRCGSDNKNIALCGSSGAGKSFFVETLAKSVYAKGGKVWILDKGASYKKLTRMLGGAYLDHRRIFLNPFTHLDKFRQADAASRIDDQGAALDPMKEALSNITALFATMASPYQELDPYPLAVLGDAILRAWEAHGPATRVDEVQHALFELADEQGQDRRIRDIGVQLNKYCASGVYGETFNQPSMLDPDVEFTTLELDGFNEEMLRPVIFALIVTINQQMYLSGDRAREKLCIIEEAWSLLSGANAQARLFINTGYRTARKFGGAFCTVTQGIEDFFASAEAKACYDNSDIHGMLRQGEGFDAFLNDHPNAFSELEQRLIKAFPPVNEAGYSCLRLKAGGQVTYHRVFSDPFTRACLSTEPHEYDDCEARLRQGVPLMAAIEATAQRFYGDDIAAFEAALKAKQERRHDL